MRLLMASLGILLLLAPVAGVSAAPLHPAQQDPPPTYQELQFTQQAMSRWVAPYVGFGQFPGTTHNNYLHPSKSKIRIAMDSQDFLHTVQIIGGTLPNGTEYRRVIYQNNRPGARAANGFSDPVVLKEYLIDLSPPYTNEKGLGLDSLEMSIDDTDKIQVVWRQSVYRLGSTYGNLERWYSRLFAVTADAMNPSFGGPVQLTPELSFAPAGGLPHLTLTYFDYINLQYRRAPNGKLYAGMDVTGEYVYRSGLGNPYNSSFRYVAFVDVQTSNLQRLVASTSRTIVVTPPDGDWAESVDQTSSLRKLAVSKTGEPLAIWDQYVNTDPNHYLQYGGLADRTGFDLDFVPSDFFFDNHGDTHLYGWAQDVNHFLVGGRYRKGPAGTTKEFNQFVGIPEVQLDSKDQHYYFPGDDFLDTLSTDIMVRQRNDQDQLSDSFTSMGNLGIGDFRTFESPGLYDFRISKNGRFAFCWRDSCMQSEQWKLSPIDGAVLRPVFPGGAVNVGSGNLTAAIPLYSTSGVGPCQSLSLLYNSMDVYTGLVGTSWRLNAEVRLIPSNQSLYYSDQIFPDATWNDFFNDDEIVLVRPDGRRVTFRFSKNSNCYRADEFESTDLITRLSYTTQESEYKLTTISGEVMYFNTNGRLRRTEDAQGRYMEYFYNGANQLTDIVDMNGQRSASLEYNGNFLKRVTDPNNHHYSFTYNGNRLSTVTFDDAPTATTYGFEYHGETNPANRSFKGYMSRFKTPRGTAGNYGWTCTYAPNGRFAKVEDPSERYLLETELETVSPIEKVASMSFRYNGSDTSEIDRRGYRTKYVSSYGGDTLLEIHDHLVLEQVAGVSPIRREFNSGGRLSKVTDRWKLETRYEYAGPSFYNQNLKEVWRPKASGDGQDMVASYTYTDDRFNNLKTAITYATPTEGSGVKVRTTTYDYNINGQLTEIKYPNVDRPDGSSRVDVKKRFEYSSSGRYQMEFAYDEDNHKTTFSNFDPITGLPQNILREGGSQPLNLGYYKSGQVQYQTLPQGGPFNEGSSITSTVLDGMNRPFLVIDPKGGSTSYEYDADSNLQKTQGPAGGPTFSTYDRRGFPSGGDSPDGSWQAAVDANGNTRITTDSHGGQSVFKFDPIGRMTERTIQAGSTKSSGGGGGETGTQKTEWTYDIFDNGKRSVSTTEYGSPETRVTTTTLDNRGRPTEVLAPDGKTKVQTFYDELDQVVARQVLYPNKDNAQQLDVQTCSVAFRDDRDRVTRVRRQNTSYGTAPSESSNSYSIFNDSGSIRTIVDPLGNPGVPDPAHKVTFIRDERDRVQYVFDGYNNLVRENVYGDDDLLSEVKVPDPQSKTLDLVSSVRYAYTSRKEIKTVTDVLNNSVSYEYGPLQGQVTLVTDALGRKTKTTYNTQTQRPDSVTRGYQTTDASLTQYTWQDGLLKETVVWNPEAGSYTAVYTNTYDKMGRFEYLQYPSTGKGLNMADRKQTYTPCGEAKRSQQGAQVVETVPNKMGQPEFTSFEGFGSFKVSREFNGLGMLSSIGDGGAGHVGELKKGFSYDMWKGTPSFEQFTVDTQNWTYHEIKTDNAGSVTAFTDGNDGHHAWPTDANNRPKEKQFELKTIASLEYTPGGLLSTETVRNATGDEILLTTYFYDKAGRLKRKIAEDKVARKVLYEYEWEYWASGEVLSVDLRPLGVSISYTYTARGELQTEQVVGNNGGEAAPAFTNSFTDEEAGNSSSDSDVAEADAAAQLAVDTRYSVYEYDPAGNRLSMTVNGSMVTYEYNALSQLLVETYPAKTVEHDYDDRGNEGQRKTTEGNTVTIETFEYNYMDLLSDYLKFVGDVTIAHWQYDYWPTGERYAKTDLLAHQKQVFLCRAGDVVTEYTQSDKERPAESNTYVQGLGIDSKTTRISSTGARRHFVGDQVGTMGLVLDDAAGVVERSLKDAWGVQIAGGSTERFSGLAQRETDNETGLVYMRHRFYDPRMGRFTQTDPILANQPLQHYMYTGNNPVTSVDPFGLQEEDKRRGLPRDPLGRPITNCVGGFAGCVTGTMPDTPEQRAAFFAGLVGAGQFVQATVELGIAGGLVMAPEPSSKLAAGLVAYHSFDLYCASWSSWTTGCAQSTQTARIFYSSAKELGLSDGCAEQWAFLGDSLPAMAPGLLSVGSRSLAFASQETRMLAAWANSQPRIVGGAALSEFAGAGGVLDSATAAATLREGALLAEANGVSFQRSIGMSAEEAIASDLIQVRDRSFIAIKSRLPIDKARATYGLPILNSEGQVVGVGRTFWVCESTVARGPHAVARALAHEAWERRMIDRLLGWFQKSRVQLADDTWNAWVGQPGRTPHGRALRYEARMIGGEE